MSKKLFGTDGIRGRVGTFPITPELILRLGWAAGRIFSRAEGRGTVLIGKDTRISGYMFESALEAGLVSAGSDVLLTGPMPTPAIAYLTQTFKAKAGIVISASHNPYTDNGVKFFSNQGTKLGDDIEAEIERELEHSMDVVDAGNLGKVRRIDDAAGRYIEFCKGTVSPQLNLRGLKIVVDTANGSTYQVGPAVFRELGAEVISIGDRPDGFNINKKVGSTQTEALKEALLTNKADLGIAFDGDGDRVLMLDHQGNLVDGDVLLYILATYLHKNNQLKGGVVGTLMTNLGVERALRTEGIDFVRSQVGDRHVNEILLAKNWQLGGEASGHIIYRNATTTGDGIISALQILKVLVYSKFSLQECAKNVTVLPMQMISVPITRRVNKMDLQKIERQIKYELGEDGRVLLRLSGTEPVVRVMVEGNDKNQVSALCHKMATKVENIVSY